MKLLTVFRSSIFFAGHIATLIFFVVTAQVLWVAPASVRYAYIHLWARFTIRWLKWTCGVNYQVHGRENIDLSKSGVILAKHESAWETFAFQEFFPRQTFVLKQELLKIPFFGWGLKMMGPIAIDRKAGRKAMKQVIDQGTEKLAQGVWVVIFPEGTRTRHGKIGKINAGGAILAQRSGVNTYFVSHNAGQCWPTGSLLIYPGTIDVYISSPIEPSEFSVEEINQQLEDWFKAHLTPLSEFKTEVPKP
ncbi:lysophospholipid acyltransferase family protein [Hydrogenovibrio kuenenii]|uniref:lysophospholipid acyltransferase family protein n=1 Tax=Hydrogenovibrio kuenenii TaxID=63658 RepID=UPI0004631D6E|nr:lysophospholipid acyltransferase family protein [Hydrogenovibrio kuenenii]